MMRNVRREAWGFVMVVVTVVTCLPSQAGENILSEVVPTSGVVLVRPGAHAEIESALPNQGTNVFLTLLLANSLKDTPQPVSTELKPKVSQPMGVGTPRPMTMLAISCSETSSSQSFSILCRTYGSLSNATSHGRIVMKGVVTQDVVSNGKILIQAGSKVSGIGHVDPDSGRVEAKGDWSILMENQEIRVHAEALDATGGFHGIPGQETSFENQLSQRQAVARDGRYCFLPDKTPFVLSITGEVIIRVLQPLESSE